MYVCIICISVFRTYLVFLCLASNGVNLCDSSGSHLYLVAALVFLFLFLCMSRGGVVFDLCCVFFCILCFCVCQGERRGRVVLGKFEQANGSVGRVWP